VIRTLKSYLAKDLAKATALATVALTLVMTVFAVIEPLRERGLSSQQALKLFGFSMPVMVSMALPIASLFAATIVYGRFSQDNELMACRASGISTLALLRPAVWLGLVVSLVTLALWLYVAPRLLWMSQYAVKNNLQHIAFHGLRTKGHIEFSGRLLHADHVDPEKGWMEGVIALDISDSRNVAYVVASEAELKFSESDARTFVMFQPVNYVARWQSGGPVLMLEREKIRRGELPNLFEDEPKMYDWPKLREAWSSPAECAAVRERIQQIRQQICTHLFCDEVIDALNRKGEYGKLRGFAASGEAGPDWRVELRASSAEAYKNQVRVPRRPRGGRPPQAPAARTVAVREYEGNRLTRISWAAEVDVRSWWDEFHSAHLVSLTLRNVHVREADEPASVGREKNKVEVGPLAVPLEIVRRSRAIDLSDLRDHPEKYGLAGRAKCMVESLDEHFIERLRAKVCAEIHLRLGYAVSCMLMVMLGAALGLLFRGGQMLAAFAISAVPASIVIVILFMGKELIKSPGVPEAHGIAVIWGGVAALALATAYVYCFPMRR